MEIGYVNQLPNEIDLYELYGELNWNTFLKLPPYKLRKALENSFYTVSAYCEGKLVGTGRIVSDGVMNAFICGLGVSPEFQGNGIGTRLFKQLTEHAERNALHIQFFCEDEILPYYEKLGFKKFANGMMK
ncbi:GNAT family N-acetyltransferase [Sporosarcina limicola]|uniref:Ribosomal protein S18 acetylase RimI-like enzyme n=1 Tax=Sporosarcina limicola TaxID=34101 RepID=A0A927R3W3_9BACL|nr:GNAT family N-acetyltransferase [Sporosarcina limicola]MBE1554193.1 ribosomal protein S18 acetylase RimI-like enzyme [Sporosarcina limicola]